MSRAVEQVVEDIKYKLFDDNSFDPELTFSSWTGDSNSFVVTKDDKKFKLSVEEVTERKIKVIYDYQDVAKVYPLTLTSIREVFNNLRNDAGMIVQMDDREYFFERMEDFYDGILTCMEEKSAITIAPIKEFYLRETGRFF